MNVQERDARDLLCACNWPLAADTARFTLKRLATKLNSMPSWSGEVCPAKLTEKQTALFKAVCDEVNAGNEIVIEADDDTATEPETKPAAKGGKGRKKTAEVIPPGKGGKAAVSAGKKAKEATEASGKGRGVGIIDTIFTLIEKGSEDKPVSQEKILETLKKKYPDRRPEAMIQTIRRTKFNAVRRGVVVAKNKAGFWIE